MSQSSVAAQADWSPELLMQDLAAVKEAELTFVETRSSSFLIDEMRLTGKMHYRAPDFIVKSVATPFVQIITIDGDTISIEKQTTRGESTTQRYSLSASEALNTAVAGIRATLAGDLPAIVGSYNIEMEGDRSSWSVLLTPKLPAVQQVIQQISVSGSHGKISIIDTVNADGDESRLTLSYVTIR